MFPPAIGNFYLSRLLLPMCAMSVPQSISLSVTNAPNDPPGEAAWDSACMCAVIRCSFCQITLASCLFFFLADFGVWLLVLVLTISWKDSSQNDLLCVSWDAVSHLLGDDCKTYILLVSACRLLKSSLVALTMLRMNVMVGWSVSDDAPVPIHWLAGTRSSQVWRRIHRLCWSGAQDQGTVRSGRTNHRSLQVKCLVPMVDLLINFFTKWSIKLTLMIFYSSQNFHVMFCSRVWGCTWV